MTDVSGTMPQSQWSPPAAQNIDLGYTGGSGESNSLPTIRGDARNRPVADRGDSATSTRQRLTDCTPGASEFYHFRDSPGLHSCDTSGPQSHDSSGALFSMYSKIGEEEDNKMIERWRVDADGILIFVSPRLRIHIPTRVNWSSVGRFILCRRGSATFRDGSGLEPKSSASASTSEQLGVLSQEYLSGSVPPERLMSTPFFDCR